MAGKATHSVTHPLFSKLGNTFQAKQMDGLSVFFYFAVN